MIGVIKRTVLPKTGLQEKQLLHAAYSVQDNVEDVEDIKTSHNRFLTDFLEFISLLWKTSKMYVYKLQCRSWYKDFELQ